MAPKPRRTHAAPARLPLRVVLYASRSIQAVDSDAVAQDLASCAPGLADLERRGDLAQGEGGRAFLAAIAGLRVRDPVIPDTFHTATTSDLEIEESIDAAPQRVGSAQLAYRLYDGNRLAQQAAGRIAPGERSLDVLHVWATRRLAGTYSMDGMRYHARYAVFGYPTVFSLLGLGLAPAPSLEAALFARELARRGADQAAIEAELDAQYPEEKVDIDDQATVNAALASVILQAAAALADSPPFCGDPKCRLFNPHRKRELRASLLTQHLCAAHARLFAKGARRG